MIGSDSLVVPDPYGSVYEYKAMENPDFSYGMVPMPKWKVDAVNKIVELAKGADAVKSEHDWNVVGQLVVFFIQNFPDEWKQFKSSIPDIRATRRAGGYSKSREIKYVGAIPLRLERMIKICFPYNQFNKEFVNRFVKRFGAFRVGGEGN